MLLDGNSFQAVYTEDGEGADTGMEVNQLPQISNCVCSFCYSAILILVTNSNMCYG